MFSVLAVSSIRCEALEQTVKREVREEVGIEIDGLRYVASQPWSFQFAHGQAFAPVM